MIHFYNSKKTLNCLILDKEDCIVTEILLFNTNNKYIVFVPKSEKEVFLLNTKLRSLLTNAEIFYYEVPI